MLPPLLAQLPVFLSRQHLMSSGPYPGRNWLSRPPVACAISSPLSQRRPYCHLCSIRVALRTPLRLQQFVKGWNPPHAPLKRGILCPTSRLQPEIGGSSTLLRTALNRGVSSKATLPDAH